MNPWERRPFPPLDLGAVDFDSIRWLVLDLFGPFLCSCACRFGEHWASSARLTVLVRAASQQQAEALVGSRAHKPRHAAARAAGQARRQRTDAQQQLQGREAIWPLAWHMAAGRQALAGKH